MREQTHSRPRRGRPPSETAESHAAILDAVYELLQTQTVRDLTMEAVAKRAGVGKPTLYKWWPTKGALVLAMFRERIAARLVEVPGESAEAAIRNSAIALIREFRGPLGKITAELIAEGQSEPEILRRWFDEHIRHRRAALAAEVERGKAKGEVVATADSDLLIDAVFGGIYLRLLFRTDPLTEEFGDGLVKQIFDGVRVRSA